MLTDLALAVNHPVTWHATTRGADHLVDPPGWVLPQETCLQTAAGLDDRVAIDRRLESRSKADAQRNGNWRPDTPVSPSTTYRLKPPTPQGQKSGYPLSGSPIRTGISPVATGRKLLRCYPAGRHAFHRAGLQNRFRQTRPPGGQTTVGHSFGDDNFETRLVQTERNSGRGSPPPRKRTVAGLSVH